LHKKGGRLVVDRGEEIFIDLPLEKVDQVLISDEGAISFSALRALLERGGSVAIQGFAGEVQGAFMNMADSRIELRRSQHRRADDHDFCLGAARAIVAGKISNQRLVLRRYYRFRPEKTNEAEVIMREMQAKALSATSLDAVRGCEGAAARAYFAAWSELLPTTWVMDGRSKNPPRDPVNALLSYGYGVLFHNLLTLITQRGLEPALGALHAPRNGHPALVSDLMEEFRSLIVDVVVLNILQRGHVTPHDFSAEEHQNGCRISASARKALIRAMEEKMAAQLTHPVTGQNMDYRRAMRQQVAHWVEVVENRVPVYRPCVLR
jgi:CRISPR-associated protein Cas1